MKELYQCEKCLATFEQAELAHGCESRHRGAELTGSPIEVCPFCKTDKAYYSNSHTRVICRGCKCRGPAATGDTHPVQNYFEQRAWFLWNDRGEDKGDRS